MRKLLKKLLPERTKIYILKGVDSMDKSLIKLFSKSGFLASFYFTFISKKFYREHISVLQGRIKYWDNLKLPQSSSVLLRRNIHRLEKGLIMQPRRDVFALDYIEETVLNYQKCMEKQTLAQGEKEWAHDVLYKYFQIVASNPTIDSAKKSFLKHAENSPYQPTAIPYTKSNAIKSSICYDDFKALCQQRRSVRWYEEKKVPIELINQAIETATLAPSACNRQPFSFYVFDDPKDAQRIGKIPMGTVGFHHNFQSIIVVTGDLSAYPNERDRHVIYIDASLASMQLILSLETLGISSCVINWPDVDYCENQMTEALKLPTHERPIMLISLGYAQANGKIPFSQKKSYKNLVKEI